MAGRSLRANLFRTSLTLLGIVIGVGSVVAMLALGDGSKQAVLSRIEAMGTDLLLVRPGTRGVRVSGEPVALVPEDADAICELPNVAQAVPECTGGATLRAANPGSRFERLEIADTPPWPRFASGGLDRVVHLAAQAGVRFSGTYPHRYAQSNRVGFLNVLEGCRNHAPERLLDFIGALEGALGRPARLDLQPMQPGDVPATFADVSRLQSLTGQARRAMPLHAGVKHFVDWYRAYHGVAGGEPGSDASRSTVGMGSLHRRRNEQGVHT